MFVAKQTHNVFIHHETHQDPEKELKDDPRSSGQDVEQTGKNSLDRNLSRLFLTVRNSMSDARKCSRRTVNIIRLCIDRLREKSQQTMFLIPMLHLNYRFCKHGDT